MTDESPAGHSSASANNINRRDGTPDWRACRVLVADDQEGMTELIEHVTGDEMGCDTTTVSSGDEALALMAGGQGGSRSVLRDGPAPGTAPPPITSEPLQIPSGGEVTLPTLGEEQDPAAEGTTPVTLDDIQPAEGTSPDEDGEGN